MCLAYVSGMCVWHMCLAYVSGICVWHVCLAYVSGICVWLANQASLNLLIRSCPPSLLLLTSIPTPERSGIRGCNLAPRSRVVQKSDPMPLSAIPRLQAIRRQVVIGMFALVEGVVWLNAYESSVVKAPLFVLGASALVTIAIVLALFSGSIELPPSWIFILVPLHFILFAVSCWWSFDPPYSVSAFLFGVSCLAMFFTGVAAFHTKMQLAGFVRSIEWVTAILCIVGALQLIFGDHLPVVFFVDPQRRIPSLLGSSIFLSSYLIVMFPIILSQALHARNGSRHSWARYALLLVMVVLLFATQTRSSIVAWICALLLFVGLTYHASQKGTWLAIAAALIIAGGLYATVIQPGIADRFVRMFDESRESTFARRMYFWKAGWDAVQVSPIVGHGMGSFERTVFEYRSPEYWSVASEDIVPHAHNEILEIAVEYGIIGLALFMGTWILVLRRGYALSRTTEGWERWTAVGLLCSLVAIAIDNLGNVSLREPAIALPVWLFMGILWSTGLAKEEKPVITIAFPKRKALALLPVALWLGFVVAYAHSQFLHVDAEVHLARALLGPAGNPATTLEQYELAVQEDPSNLFARSRLTQEFLALHRWDDAVAAADGLQRRSPMYPQSSLMKSYALLQLGRFRESLEWIQRELRERSHPVAYQIQAEAYHGLRNREGEQEAIRQFLRGMLHMKAYPPYRRYCFRLAEISRSVQDRREDDMLLDTLGRSIPADREFFRQVKDRLHTTER